MYSNSYGRVAVLVLSGDHKWLPSFVMQPPIRGKWLDEGDRVRLPAEEPSALLGEFVAVDRGLGR